MAVRPQEPVGAVAMSANDAAIFMRMLLNQTRYDGGRLLSEKAWARITEPAFEDAVGSDDMGWGFMLNDVDSVHYDQVKGRNMFGTFKNNELRTLYVSGNGQTMYYIYDSKQGEYIGGYRADCSNMLIKLSEKKVQTINFMVKPHSIIYPLDKIPIGEQRLKGFKPRFEEKPNSRNDLLP